MATGMLVFAEVELTPVGGGTATEAIAGFPACASPLTLTGVVVGPNQLMLHWSACPRVHEYWVYGATNDPFFAPGFGPGYDHRLAVLPPADLDEAVPGPGDLANNGTYLVVAVTSGGVEMTRSNRFGEFDFATGGL